MYDYPMETSLFYAEENLKLSKEKVILENSLLINKSADSTGINKMILNTLIENLKVKNEIKINIEKKYNELIDHQLLLRSLIGLFLEFSTSDPIKNLSFYRNSFNYSTWLNLNIPNSRIENSAFGIMNLSNINLSRSTIIGTTFGNSRFINCNFADSEITATNFTNIEVKNKIDFSGVKFNDVFFLGANLKNSNFMGALDLKPIYFYKVKDLENVQFDAEFRKELEKELITDEEFTEYVRNCKLIKLRADELIDDLLRITY